MDPIKDLNRYYRTSIPLREWIGLDAMVGECLKDPDIAPRSTEWKDGYARGLSEGILLIAQRMVDGK
jgi:hypothetical protein